MVAYAKPQQWKKEESERLRREREREIRSSLLISDLKDGMNIDCRVVSLSIISRSFRCKAMVRVQPKASIDSRKVKCPCHSIKIRDSQGRLYDTVKL